MHTHEEEDRCTKDFAYFCKTYAKAMMYCELHEKYGQIIPVELYDYQKRYIAALESNQCLVTNSYRVSGLTTINQFYLLWKCLFNKDQQCLSVFGTDRACCWDGSQTIHYAYREFPEWIQEMFGKQNDHTIEFKNGSVLNFFSCDVAVNRVCTTTTYVALDRIAFWRIDPRIFLDKLFSIVPNVNCSVISTPNGIEGNSKEFFELYCEAVAGLGKFKNFELHYSENAHIAKRIEQIKINLGEKNFKQEMDGYFMFPNGEFFHPLKPSPTDASSA